MISTKAKAVSGTHPRMGHQALGCRTPLHFLIDRLVQLRQQSFKPARVSTRFHAHAHLHSLRRQLPVKLLRFLTVLQRPFLELSSIRIHKRNLLETRVVICSYNDHCPAPFYPSLFGWLWHHQAYSGLGAGIVMESIKGGSVLRLEAMLLFSPEVNSTFEAGVEGFIRCLSKLTR